MVGEAERSTHHGPFLSHCGHLRTAKLRAHFFKQLALPLVVFSLSTLFKDAFADIPRLFPGLQALLKCLVAGAC
jgi:hypothetical protein